MTLQAHAIYHSMRARNTFTCCGLVPVAYPARYGAYQIPVVRLVIKRHTNT
jgi:hypothetical protein